MKRRSQIRVVKRIVGKMTLAIIVVFVAVGHQSWKSSDWEAVASFAGMGCLFSSLFFVPVFKSWRLLRDVSLGRLLKAHVAKCQACGSPWGVDLLGVSLVGYEPQNKGRVTNVIFDVPVCPACAIHERMSCIETAATASVCAIVVWCVLVVTLGERHHDCFLFVFLLWLLVFVVRGLYADKKNENLELYPPIAKKLKEGFSRGYCRFNRTIHFDVNGVPCCKKGEEIR